MTRVTAPALSDDAGLLCRRSPAIGRRHEKNMVGYGIDQDRFNRPRHAPRGNWRLGRIYVALRRKVQKFAHSDVPHEARSVVYSVKGMRVVKESGGEIDCEQCVCVAGVLSRLLLSAHSPAKPVPSNNLGREGELAAASRATRNVGGSPVGGVPPYYCQHLLRCELSGNWAA
jgi:hypothetical protein